MNPLIETVKTIALNFPQAVNQKMRRAQKTISQLRVKVIVFRDYWADSISNAMEVSDFYNLEHRSDEFSEHVSRIYSSGGGDEPENALEALTIAMRSRWETKQDFVKQRHITVLFTDASAHSLEKMPKIEHYPRGLPTNLDQLTQEWYDMPSSSKRLVLFAPDVEPWSLISATWDSCIHFPAKPGDGLQEFEWDDILQALASSV